MVTHTQHCFTDKVTLKLTVYGGDTCPHQQKELHRQEYIPVMRFFRHPNVFTSQKINGTAVISLVFISKQYEYESLFSSLPTAQFKLKICSLSKGLICHRFELWPCFFESTANPQPRAAKIKNKKLCCSFSCCTLILLISCDSIYIRGGFTVLSWYCHVTQL